MRTRACEKRESGKQPLMSAYISRYSFLDKIYCLSSSEALAKFIRNPRSYIMDPYPCPPCKICVVGPPCSGKTTLAKNLAQRYQAQVI